MEPRRWGLIELRPLLQYHPARKSQGSRVPYSDSPKASVGPSLHHLWHLESRLCTFMHTLTPEFEMNLDMKAAHPSPHTHALVEKEQGEKRKGGGLFGASSCTLGLTS